MSKILELVEAGRIFEIYPAYDSTFSFLTKEEMIAIFNYFGAFWQYEGKPCPEKPHALLKSGLHSNGFIVCKDVLQYPFFCSFFASQILKHLRRTHGCFAKGQTIDVVVSSAYSAITLGYEVARKIVSNELNQKIEYIPVEKDEKGNPTIIRGGIDPSKNVLILNELMTTGSGSTWETKRAVLACNGSGNSPKIIEPSYVLVHRSKDYELLDGSKVFPIFHFDIENYKPEECPYCKAGSEAIKPKLDNNWDRLHGRI